MTPKRPGRGDTGFQPMLADHLHNAFYGKSLSHSSPHHLRHPRRVFAALRRLEINLLLPKSERLPARGVGWTSLV